MLERTRIRKENPYPLKHRIYWPEKREYRAPPRKPLAKSMTIAAAFVCLDGIVLAADSEYTYNYSKYEGEKLFQFVDDNWAIGIAAAGTMGLAKMFISDLKRKFTVSKDIQSLHDAIIERAKYFNEEYIRKSNEPRQLLLLIAIQLKSAPENLLLKISGDVVEPVQESDFIGAGDEIARATASWIFHPHMPARVVQQVALQVLYWTTEHVQFCGKATYALIVPKPWRQTRSFSWFQINEFFWGLNELLQPILNGCMNPQLPQDGFEAQLQAFVDKMRAVRAASIQAAAPFPGTNPSSPTEPERQP